MSDNRNSRKKNIPKVLSPSTNSSEPMEDEPIGIYNINQFILNKIHNVHFNLQWKHLYANIKMIVIMTKHLKIYYVPLNRLQKKTTVNLFNMIFSR